MARVSLTNSGPSADEVQQQNSGGQKTDRCHEPSTFGSNRNQLLPLTQHSPTSANQVSPLSRHWAQTLTLPHSHIPLPLSRCRPNLGWGASWPAGGASRSHLRSGSFRAEHEVGPGRLP